MQRSAPASIDAKQPCNRPSTRSWVTAGVAVAGVGMIALAPSVTSAAPLAQPATDAAAVQLAADWKPFTAYIDAFNKTSANASTLFGNFMLAPGVSLQQAIVNQAGYLQQVIDDPSTIDTVIDSMRSNLKAIATGLTLIGADADTTSTVTNHSVDGLHGVIVSMLPQFLPADSAIDPAVVSAVMNVLASPLSGVLIGLAGPVVSPVVAVLNSAITIAAAVQAGDRSAAFSDLWDAPAKVIDSVFNGATLDLTALTPMINDTGLLGGTTLNSLDIAFGGLFTPGSIGRGTYDVNDGTIAAAGGSILNSVGLNLTTDALGFPLTLDIPGQAVGPIGALEGMSQTVGALLGDNWDGKDGKVIPPLAGLEFPQLPGGSTSTTDAAEKLAAAYSDTKSASPTSDTASADAPALKTVKLDVGSPADDQASSSTRQDTTETPSPTENVTGPVNSTSPGSSSSDSGAAAGSDSDSASGADGGSTSSDSSSSASSSTDSSSGESSGESSSGETSSSESSSGGSTSSSSGSSSDSSSSGSSSSGSSSSGSSSSSSSSSGD